jgi:hypothetical protein
MSSTRETKTGADLSFIGHPVCGEVPTREAGTWKFQVENMPRERLQMLRASTEADVLREPGSWKMIALLRAGGIGIEEGLPEPVLLVSTSGVQDDVLLQSTNPLNFRIRRGDGLGDLPGVSCPREEGKPALVVNLDETGDGEAVVTARFKNQQGGLRFRLGASVWAFSKATAELLGGPGQPVADIRVRAMDARLSVGARRWSLDGGDIVEIRGPYLLASATRGGGWMFEGSSREIALNGEELVPTRWAGSSAAGQVTAGLLVSILTLGRFVVFWLQRHRRRSLT